MLQSENIFQLLRFEWVHTFVFVLAVPTSYTQDEDDHDDKNNSSQSNDDQEPPLDVERVSCFCKIHGENT